MTKDIWAVIPIKELGSAKTRLACLLTPAQRKDLMVAMIGDVLEALDGATRLAGLTVVTVDPIAMEMAKKVGARVQTAGAHDGHTGSILAARTVLLHEQRAGMLVLPGDIPCIASDEIDSVLSSHGRARAFTIVPSHDDLGSNMIVCSPPDAVALCFGENSFYPHVDAAKRQGITPRVIRSSRIALDVDHPCDLAALYRLPQSTGTRTRTFLGTIDGPRLLEERGLLGPEEILAVSFS